MTAMADVMAGFSIADADLDAASDVELAWAGRTSL